MRAPLAFLLMGMAMPAADTAFGQASQDPAVYAEFNYGQDTGGNDWIQCIQILEPACRSAVDGPVRVRIRAPGMTTATAACWQQPTGDRPGPWGNDRIVADFSLDADGTGAFVFPAPEFPRGPVTLRILARGENGRRDIFELQLYNRAGTRWNQGIPPDDPPAAKGLQLVFADDFDQLPSIAADGRGARYNAHKPRFGDFSGWPFTDPSGPLNPFEHIDTYLRIKARRPEGSRGATGLLASVDMDGKGLWTRAPCYLECRFTAQSAPGTWPAFWTITNLDRGPCDELDIAECYGGVGPGNPNHPGYSIVSHFWNQTLPDGSRKPGHSATVPILDLGGRSYWSWTFHSYGVYVGLEETVYYFDDVEVLRHPTNDLSRQSPLCFLVNYAIGGISGWPVDLERYGNGSDMYVDYIRVFAEEPLDYAQPPR